MRGLRLVGLLSLLTLCVCLAAFVAQQLLKPHSIVRIASEDPQLQAVSRQAQAELPNFLDRLKRKDGDRFAIKARFETSAGPEYLWLKDPIPLPNGSISGTIDQQPIALNAHKGDTMTVLPKDIFDWMIEKNGKLEGGFTEKVLGSR